MNSTSELPPATEDMLTYTLTQLKEIESALMIKGADNLLSLIAIAQIIGRISMHLKIYGTKETK